MRGRCLCTIAHAQSGSFDLAKLQPPTAAASRLRARIDQGRTGDKVAFPDPAAAPLGVDDEAAGAVSDPAAIEASSRRQQAIHEDRIPQIEADKARRRAPVWPYAAIVLVALAAAAFYLFGFR